MKDGAIQGGINVNIRDHINNLWASIDRPGAERLVDFLEESDFYTAPCSTKYHLAKPGGLAEHSLNVYLLLGEKVKRYGLDVPESTIIICGLGHDLCKVGIYKEGGEPAQGRQLDWAKDLIASNWGRFSEGEKDIINSLITKEDDTVIIAKSHASLIISWLKDGYSPETMPEFPVSYSVDDPFPMGHGEKSVSILQNYIQLTDEEKLAIRWHMTAFDASIHFDYPNGFAFRKAAEISPLVTLLFTADYEASQILEKE